MRTNWVALLAFFALTLTAFITVVQTLPPSPKPADVSSTEFSAERAVKHIRIIAEQPRPTGSAANASARGYILNVLNDLGLETETQPAGNLVNVMGRIVGNSSTDAVLLTAHLDSVKESRGATDDGSGVAVLLETARALMSEMPFRNTIIFLFTDSEETGSDGAKAFIADHPWARDVRVVIGFDAGGLSGPGILSTTSHDNGWLIRQLARADSYLVGSSAINALAESGTDFGHVFKAAGFSGYAFDLYWDRRIHTIEDSIGNLNLSSIQHQGYHALSLARYFGNLDRLSDPKEPDMIYFTVLRLFTSTYPIILAVPLAIVITVVFLTFLIFGIKRGFLSWGGIGYGIFVVLVGTILAPLPGILLGRWIPGMPFRFVGRSLDRPSEVSLAVLLALVLIILWYFISLKIKHACLPCIYFGALVPMLIGMLGTSMILPALSFAFTWPLVFSLLASANWYYCFSQLKNSKLVILGLIISGMITIVIMGPTILLGLFDQPALTLLLLGVLCGFLLPQIYLMLGYRMENLYPI